MHFIIYFSLILFLLSCQSISVRNPSSEGTDNTLGDNMIKGPCSLGTDSIFRDSAGRVIPLFQAKANKSCPKLRDYSNVIEKYGSTTTALVEREILSLFDKNDVVVVGEDHETLEHRQLVRNLVLSNCDSNQYGALATEALVDSKKADIAYSSFKNSGNQNFFSTKGIQAGLWFSSGEIRKIFNSQRKCKQSILCPIDALTDDDNPQNRVKQALNRYQNFPEKVQNKVLEISGFPSLKKLAEDRSWYDREILMAMSALKCLSYNKKILLHVGASHGFSEKLGYIKQFPKESPPFWPMTRWMKFLKPNLKVATIHNYVLGPKVRSENLDGQPLLKAIVKHYDDHDISGTYMIPAKALPGKIRNDFSGQHNGIQFQLWGAADYYIVGPTGKDDPHSFPRPE